MNTKEYEIDGLMIEWEKTLKEIYPLFDKRETLNPFGGWPNIRGNCSQIFGLKATEFNLRAPMEEKPVLQVSFELSPIQPGIFEKSYSPFVKQLKKVLGNPKKSESIPIHKGLKKEYLYGAVIYSAKWINDDIRISLSVYGDTRNNNSGPAAAGIFIDWINEKKAALPFLENMQKIEQRMSELIDGNTSVKKFRLKYKQRPFRVVHYELKDPYIAEKDSALRVSQMALYNRELYQTCNFIQKSIAEDEIALYTLPELNKTFVSNKWDTVSLSSSDEGGIVYYELLPARGPGSQKLHVKELQIDDDKNSNALINLYEEIEKITGLKTQIRKGYDD